MKIKYVFLLIFLVILYILNSIYPMKIYTFISLFLFLLVAFELLYYNPKYIFINFLLVFYTLFNVISIILIDVKPIFLNELNTTSSFNGSSTYFIVLVTIFLILSEIIFNKYFNHKDITIKKSIGKFFFLFNLINFVLLFLFIWDKPEFTLGIGRHSYRSMYLTSNTFIYILQALFNLSGIIIGLVYTFNRKLAIVPILFIIVYGFWIGEKFGFFFRNFSYFIMFLGFYHDNQTLKKIMMKFLKPSILIIGLFLIDRLYIKGYSFMKTIEYTILRIAQQNQLTWYFYKFQDGSYGNFSDEFRHFMVPLKKIYTLGFNEITSFGQFKLMKIATNIEFVYYKILIHSRLATGVFSQFLFYFRTIFPHIIYFIILYFLVVFLIKKINNKFYKLNTLPDFIIILIYFKLIERIILAGFFQSVSDFVNISILENVLLIFIASFLITLVKKRRQT